MRTVDARPLIGGFQVTSGSPSRRFGGGARLAGVPLLIALGVAGGGCAPEEAAPVDTRIAAASAPDLTGSGNLDILFMIDNSSGMTEMQSKLADQVPGMLSALESLPTGFPQHPHRGGLVGHGRPGRQRREDRVHADRR